MTDMLQADSIFSDFYAAAAGRTDWRKPFTALSDLLGLWGVQVIGIDKRTGGLLFSAEGGVAPPEAALDYIRFFHASNPRIAPALATPITHRVHARIERHDLRTRAGERLEIQPGMTGTVEIKTGERTIWEFLTKPITRTLHESLREK
jgi:hypothetical protein